MKKNYFLLLAFLSVIVNAQIVNIPDANFKSLLVDYQPAIDTNNDGQIQVSEAQAVTALNIYYDHNEQDLTGIRSFTNLTSLTIANQLSLTAIDLHDMTNLQSLSINFDVYVSSINMSGLTNLQNLNLSSISQMNAIDFTGCGNLKTLRLDMMQAITSLDLSLLPHLESLDMSLCSSITSLNLSGFTELKAIALTDMWLLNQINLLGLTALTDFSCRYSNLSTINLSSLPNLKNVEIAYNDLLTSLNCNNAIQLEHLYCWENSLTQLQMSGANNLRYLECSRNNLSSINLNGKTLLEKLVCSQNQFTSLDLTGLNALQELYCSYNQIAVLDVAPFTGLTKLSCDHNLLTSLNVSPLTNLTELSCGYNNLVTLNVSSLVNLVGLYYDSIQTAGVDISALHNLEGLDTSNNPINVLDVTDKPNLKALYCDNNNLSVLNLSQQTQLETLRCSSNHLTDLHLVTTYRAMVSCFDNEFTSLDLSNLSLSDLLAGNNPNLVDLNLKDGHPEINLPYIDVSDCPNFRYLCVDDTDIQNAFLHIYPGDAPNNVQINSYCSFTPGGNHNTITGKFRLDADNNGCDANDMAAPAIRVGLNDGTQTGATFTIQNGDYSFNTMAGNFVITPNLEHPYFSVSPTSTTVNFAAADSSSQNVDFCISPVGVHYDVEIALFPGLNPRPGFDTSYVIIFQNNGNQIQSGNVSLAFDNAILDFVSADPQISSQTTGQLNWAYTNLMPFETRVINVLLNVNGPMETPPVNIGDMLHFTATIQPVGGDQNPADDVAVLDQVVNGSFDPNDKTCLEGSTITPDKVGDYLHYVIRFQNSGSAPAEFIVVKDIIDTTKFDIASLQLIASSHPQTTRINGDKVEFFFENINLPAESVDEPGSHGYVAFKIKTKNNLAIGNSVSNTADIYFDYNWPITTNTATTTVALLAKDTFEDQSVTMYPNPVKNKLHVSAIDNITSIQLFDVQGRLIQTTPEKSKEVVFDLAKHTSGIYFVKVYTDQGVKVEKIIKE